MRRLVERGSLKGGVGGGGGGGHSEMGDFLNTGGKRVAEKLGSH